MGVTKGVWFTDEFKRDAVAQVVERGYAVSEVAERLGISTKSLYTWKAQFAKSPHERAEVLDQAAEIRRLKRELARVTEERTILKKATTYFVRESQ
ncbi:putative IS3 family transposase [Octadecabacter arcticus 238]|uniref:Putative IS3 family transposase n=1 Tax=Octadecabacter arcticus 238 TaxID=391616 RepID=M9RH76_9RHOB|nr:putative IS3 family transposase [Octadecabacter arcticus 238]